MSSCRPGQMKTPARHCGGFSLIEVLVAFSIMAMSLGALYQSVGTSVRNMQRVESTTRAAVIAQSILNLYPFATSEGISASGVSPDGFTWVAASRAYESLESPTPGSGRLVYLDVRVSWSDGSSARDFRLTTLIPEVGA